MEISLQNIWTVVDKPPLHFTTIAINSCLATQVLANKLTARNPGEGWPTHMKISKIVHNFYFQHCFANLNVTFFDLLLPQQIALFYLKISQ